MPLRPGTRIIRVDRAPGDPACGLCRGMGVSSKTYGRTGIQKECKCITAEAREAKRAEVERHNKTVDQLRALTVTRQRAPEPTATLDPPPTTAK